MYDFLELLGYEEVGSIDLPEETISDDIFSMETELVEEIEVDDLYLSDIVQQNAEQNNFYKNRCK